MINENDILIFKNGSSKLFHESERWIINAFYDKDLNCLKDDNYSIVEIKKAEYKILKKER